jgi:S-adenosyl-L-methionine hydrolase (adenosine-forming)
MKGVILTTEPTLKIIDISHQIPAQNIRRAAQVLADIIPYYPNGTVHCCVVDPGVGTHRIACVFQIGDQWVVAPDNGIISKVFDATIDRAWHLPESQFARVSNTFHGRDLFAPMSALLASGQKKASSLAPIKSKPIILRDITPIQERDGAWTGEVMYSDAFGNLITNLPGDLLKKNTRVVVKLAQETEAQVVQTYGEAHQGTLVALVGSTDLIEIALVNQNASRLLEIGCGIQVQLI